jgi:transcriptional regulator with XRE-family HTH domain
MMEDVEYQRFLEDVKKLNLQFPVAKIAEVTSYSKSLVSAYLSGKRSPSVNFLNRFYNSELFKETFLFQEPLFKYNSYKADMADLIKQLHDKQKELETLRSMIVDKDRLIQTQDELIEMLKGAKGKNGDSHTNKSMQPG